MNARTLRTLAAVVLALGFAAEAPAQTQVSFGTYVSIGDSLAAGYSSGSLVETNQRTSVPALLARQAGGADFQQPLISEPGIPTQLALVSLVPGVLIAPKASNTGVPKNLALPRPYNNLAVPGATSIDALTRTRDGGGFHDLILRGLGTQIQQAAALHPTFVTLWIGNNDLLGAAIRGRAIDGVTLTPTTTFRDVYTGIIAGLKATNATIVAANLPDVTTIPFVTTIKPYVINPITGEPVLANGNRIPLIGPAGPLPAASFVTLAAQALLLQGTGIPRELGGNGQPLPDEVILDPSEVAIIRDHVDRDNQAIREICQQAGVPVLDIKALVDEFATTGRVVGGVQLTSAFLTGGIFGYDGVHPSALGYAVVANEWIQTINQNGGSLPEVDLAPFLGLGVSAQSARAASRPTPPFVFTREAYESLLLAFPTVDGR